MDIVYDDSLTDTDKMAEALIAGGYSVEEIIRPDDLPDDLSDEEHINVTALEAKELISSEKDLVIMDVREYEEFCDSAGHIPDALNYPWNSGILHVKYSELPMEFPILVVCGTGLRSDAASRFLFEQGYTVYDMSDSMEAWIWERETCDTPEPDNTKETESVENTGGAGDEGGGCFISAVQ